MKVLLTFLLIVSFFGSTAQFVTWDGGAGTHAWEDANNWNPNGVPCSTCDVVIDNDSVLVNSVQTVKSITVQHSNLLSQVGVLGIRSNGTLIVSNSSGVGVDIQNDCNLRIVGKLNIQNSSSIGLRLEEGLAELTNILAELNIEDVLGSGLVNSNGEFNNKGQLTILNAGSRGIENTSILFNNHEMTIDNPTEEGFLNTDRLINNGDLDMSNCEICLVNQDSLLNNDRIHVTEVDSIGILHEGESLINGASGTVEVENITYTGMLLKSKLINEGSISIHDSENHGVYWRRGRQADPQSLADSILNYGSFKIYLCEGTAYDYWPPASIWNIFKNFSGAELEIYSIESDAMGTSVAANEGKIHIRNINGEAGYFGESYNSDTIIVEDVATGLRISNGYNTGFIYANRVGGSALEFQGFINDGVIQVDSSSGYGVEFSTNNNYNNKEIIVKNCNTGIWSNADTLFNQGSIRVENSQSAGFLAMGLGLQNLNGGAVYLDNCEEGLIGTFENDGLIDIRNIEFSAIEITGNHFRKYENRDSIIVKNIGTLFYTTQPEISFTNESEGLIKCDSALNGIITKAGFKNKGSIIFTNLSGVAFNPMFSANTYPSSYGIDKFRNDGLIQVKNISHLDSYTGSVIHVQDTLINGINGVIDIVNSNCMGINCPYYFLNEGEFSADSIDNKLVNLVGEEALLENRGHMTLNSINPQNSLVYILNGLYLNQGISKIEGVSDSGLWLNGGNFNNKGSFDINSALKITSVGIPGFETRSRFLNDSCAHFSFGGRVFINSSQVNSPSDTVFYNFGVMLQDSIHLNTWRAKSFNYGIFQEKDQIIDSTRFEFFENFGHYVKPIFGIPSEGLIEYNIVEEGIMPIYTVGTNAYAEKDLINIAANVTGTNGGLLMNATISSTDSLFLNFTSPECTEILGIPILGSRRCTQFYDLKFNGNTTSDWHDKQNWQYEVVPNPCTVAIIPNLTNCLIESNTKARAYRLETEEGAVLNIEAGAVLDVDPNN